MTFVGKSESSIFWIGQFKKWLKDMRNGNKTVSEGKYMNVWNQMIEWWNNEEKNKTGNLSDLFNDPQIGKNAINAYVDFFFEGENSNINSWQSLVNADISKSGGGTS